MSDELDEYTKEAQRCREARPVAFMLTVPERLLLIQLLKREERLAEYERDKWAGLAQFADDGYPIVLTNEFRDDAASNLREAEALRRKLEGC